MGSVDGIERAQLAPGRPGRERPAQRWPCREPKLTASGSQYCGWTESISHRFETMGNHNVCWYLQGNLFFFFFSGFLGWCRIFTCFDKPGKFSKWALLELEAEGINFPKWTSIWRSPHLTHCPSLEAPNDSSFPAAWQVRKASVVCRQTGLGFLSVSL